MKNILLLVLLFSFFQNNITQTCNFENKMLNFLEKKSSLKFLSNRKNVYIDDTNGLKRINIPLPYKYYNKDYTFVLGYTIFYELNKEKFDRQFAMINDTNSFYISINYNFKSSDSKVLTLCSVPENFSIFNSYVFYYTFSKYVIKEMTPSDFLSFDNELKQLYFSKHDERFHLSFYDFLLNLSKDFIFEDNEKYVFYNLYNLAFEEKDLRNLNHLVYFYETVTQKDFEYEIDLQGDIILH